MAEEYDDTARQEYEDEAYDEGAYDDGYDEEYDDYEDEPEEVKPVTKKKKKRSSGGFFGGPPGRILLAVIALLLVVLMALVVWKLISKRGQDGNDGGNTLPVLATAEPTSAPFVFGPAGTGDDDDTASSTGGQEVNDTYVFGAVSMQNVIQETPAPTATPTVVPTERPITTPEVTATPLPVILTNTPTPSPTPTATPTPSPSPTPTATPVPTPTPTVVIGTGVSNRDGANVRQSASSSAKAVATLKKGASVTIHETMTDKAGHVWYNVTVDDTLKEGWMRDYVIKLDAELESTPEPKREETASVEETAAPSTADADVLGTGRTNKAANIRKIMNGAVLTQVGKGKKLSIMEVCMDKSGHVWYKVQPAGSKTIGFVRDSLVTLDKGVVLPEPTNNPNYKGAAKHSATPAPENDETESVTSELGAEATATPDVMDRDIIGTAKTNREANVRKAPKNSAGIVRQVSSRLALNILAKYEDKDGKLWYEVATDSGKTHGFVRDFVVEIITLDKDAPTLKYDQQ